MNQDHVMTKANLLLSTQRALLGAIGKDIIAIGIGYNRDNNSLVLTIFTERSVSKEQKEAIEIAATEILADFPYVKSTEEVFIKYTKKPLEMSGDWVFIRLGYS